MSILDWLRKQFRRTQIKPFQLAFEMDRTSDEQHKVQVYKIVDGQRVIVENPSLLGQYGYQESTSTPQGDVIYLVNDKDRQTILSLHSMNPKLDKDGGLVFNFAPPILSYLRTKGNVAETPLSQNLKIDNKPLAPMAKIDYDSQEGITVEIGYHDPQSNELVPADRVLTAADQQFIFSNDTFSPLPKRPSQEAQKWWNQPVTRIRHDNIPEFFQRDLVLLKKEFSAVLTDKANNIQIIDTPLQPVVKIERNELGWLDFQVDYETANIKLPHSLLRKSNQPYVRVGEQTWVKNQPQIVAKTERHLEQLEATPTENGYRSPVAQFASVDEFVQSIGGKKELSVAYQAFLNQLTGFKADDKFRLSAKSEQQFEKIGVRLRPYQRAGIHWLDWLGNNYLHGLLADDMGLGKTLQTICVLNRAYEQSNMQEHSLIVAPKSVLQHWERELNNYAPELRTYLYHGSSRRQKLFHTVNPIIFISTYDIVAREIEDLKKIPFYYLVLDEATRIKNPQTSRTQTIKAINSVHRLALSGTPVENRPAEMWSIFDFLLPGHLGRHGTFQRTFENQIIAGDNQAIDDLGKRIKPFLLRRLKENVAKDLPDKIELDEWCELTHEQRELYGSFQGETKRLRDSLARGEKVDYTSNILPIITKLKQICDHPAIVSERKEPILGRSEKFDWIIDKIGEIVQQGERIVIFSHFLSMLDLLQAVGDGGEFNYIRIDGSTTNRQALIDRFNQNKLDVALCSIGATSQGVNLTSANHVIHADRWWNPASEAQATDRVHRIGQNKTVYVYRIMVQGTLEERIDKLLIGKRKLSDQIIEAASTGPRQWTREELIGLLKPLDEV